MQTAFQSRFFWIIFSIASLGAAIGGYFLFHRAFPILHITISMDRNQALFQAKSIAETLHLGPQHKSESASFSTDEMTKTFVELEGGGKQALVRMMQDKLYMPYTWVVRFFNEFDPEETYIWFTPDGTPYRFTHVISENVSRPSLTRDAALAIALNSASSSPWNINLAEYTLVEESHEEQPSKRMDHIFVYERHTAQLKEGRYRLRIIVKGDSVSEITHFVKIPDEFARRYMQMRSANDLIATIAQIAFIILYVFGGCIVGLYFLFRKNWVLWKAAFFWALFITGINSLEHLNQLPLRWMHYITSFSQTGFLLQYALSIITGSLFWFFFLFIVFAAAESLTRCAFSTHIQLWSSWNTSIASSHAILGRTIAGYLLVPFALFFTCLFYVATTAWWHWWIPSSSLFNPDILATYFPWWQSIAISLQAGFMEECLFRVVPLACAVLLGKKYGRTTWWIIGAMILQALIFGAAHANYPAQPAYARVVELIGFSTAMGLVYLRFGLLPAIITHFVYDVMWFAIPLFVAHSRANQIMVILLALIPLLIVFFARLRTNGWLSISHTAYNHAWEPSHEPEHVNPPIITTRVTPSKSVMYAITALSLCAALSFIFFTPWNHNGPSFSIRRQEARAIATHYLERKHINVSDWEILSLPITDADQAADSFQHRFVWQHASPTQYNTLLNTYLNPPYWLIRFVKFKGSIRDRSEEYRISIDPRGTVFRFEHRIPEAQEGKELSQEQACTIALNAIKENFGLAQNQLSEISAIAKKHPNRLDWRFTFATNQDYPLTVGQARINVTIGGDTVLDIDRYIHVPEQWKRTQENISFIMALLKQTGSLLIYILLIIGIFIIHARTAFAIRSVLPYFMMVGLLCIVEVINGLPKIMMYFNTSQPFFDQLFRSIIFQLIFSLIYGMLIAFKMNALNSSQSYIMLASSRKNIFLGYALGIIFAGIIAMLFWLIQSATPIWPSYSILTQTIPIVNALTSTIMNYLTITIVILLLVHVSSVLMNSRFRSYIALTLLHAIIMTSLALLATDTISRGLIAGPIMGIMFTILYCIILKLDLALVSLMTGSFFMMHQCQQMFSGAYPHVSIISLVVIVALIIISAWWYSLLTRER